MNSLKIALSFLKEPRFALYILFGPLFVGLILTFFQAIFTFSAFEAEKNKSEDVKERLDKKVQSKFIRSILYDSEEEFGELSVCRWQVEGKDEKGLLVEVPPRTGCTLDSFDISIRSSSPDTFDTAEYEEVFSGSIQQLHICRFCEAGVIMYPELDEEERYSEAKTPLAAWLFRLAALENQKLQEKVLDTVEHRDKLKNLKGDIVVWTKDKSIKVNTGNFPGDSLIILNTAAFVVVSLWLGLKSHRKVLDYFQRSGALLPLVAALGKKDFYLAVWALTLARLGMFLIPTLPMLILIFNSVLSGDNLDTSLKGEFLFTAFWILSSICSLGFLTILGSIAELKHRSSYLVVLYRYLPLFACLFGTAVWVVGTLFVDGWLFDLIRYLVAMAPILGLGALIVAPIMKLPVWVLIAHSALSLFCTSLIIKRNSEWFASHLEEI